MSSNKKTLKITLIVLFALAFAVIVGYIGYDKYMDLTTMGCHTMLFGIDVSYKPVEEAASIIEEQFLNRKISFVENGQELYNITLAEAGYSINDELLCQKLSSIRDDRKPCKLLWEPFTNYIINVQIDEKPEWLLSAVSEDRFGGADTRQASQDAYLSYNNEAKHFEIIKEVLGNQIDSSRASTLTAETIRSSMGKDGHDPLNGDIIVEVTTDFYKPADITNAQSGIVEEMNALNAKLDTYYNASVTYLFGSEVEVLDRTTLEPWILIDGTTIRLDQDAVRNYVAELGSRYDTIYVPRNFHTSSGSDIVIDGNEYGYWIDEENEYAQLLQELESGSVVNREPVYSHVGFSRNGRDDLNGNYVEVSIGAQHLWLYRNYGLVLETDVVTGKPTPERSTYTGAFPIAYKESPSVLSSDIYGYETKVQYWMPFVYGQGLHDASWRSSFGGNIYLSDGSHGCVNLPSWAAATIYENVDANFPIILY
ncbi:MAG: L,D-transpeptidase family protein [Blautia sp.]|nr:L,D-transpeptidase family protein [Blautia sp.]